MRAPQGGKGPSLSAADAVKEDYKSEKAVALHELRTLKAGREVYIQLGGIFVRASADTAEKRILEQQQQQRQQH